MPLHTLRADIDYATSSALTTYGLIGVKVWVYKGEVVNRHDQAAASLDGAADEQARKARRTTRAADSADRPRVAVKSRAEGQEAAANVEGGAPDAKAPVKRVRKAGTTDAAAS